MKALINSTALMLVLITLFGTSCGKDDPIQTNAGTVTINVNDEAGNPINHAYIYVANYVFDEAYPVFIDSTDVTGSLNTGKLLEGNYSCFVNAKRGNLNFSEQRYFQIIANDNKELTFTPFNNQGAMELTFYNYANENPIPSLNVVLVQENIYSNDSFDQIMHKAALTGITDANGKVIFNSLPTGYYDVMVYTSPTQFTSTFYNSSSLYVYKGQTTYSSLMVYW